MPPSPQGEGFAGRPEAAPYAMDGANRVVGADALGGPPLAPLPKGGWHGEQSET